MVNPRQQEEVRGSLHPWTRSTHVHSDRIAWLKCLISSCSATDVPRGRQLLELWGPINTYHKTNCISLFDNLTITCLFKIWRTDTDLSLQCSEEETNKNNGEKQKHPMDSVIINFKEKNLLHFKIPLSFVHSTTHSAHLSLITQCTLPMELGDIPVQLSRSTVWSICYVGNVMNIAVKGIQWMNTLCRSGDQDTACISW